MKTPWIPDLDNNRFTLHEQLLEAIRRDRESGALEANARLPTHRSLATSLGIGIGTVSRAYAEAERLGWLTSQVGRGTFVAAPDSPQPDDPSAPIDLSMNVQSLVPVNSRLAEALARFSQRNDLSEYAAIPPHPGIDWHRQAVADWLVANVRFTNIDWRLLLLTSGAQQAMFLAVDHLCRLGDVVLTEAATFPGFRAIADYRGLTLRGLPMDDEGLVPDALDDAASDPACRVVYLQPTLQNPSARTMSLERRTRIAEIARARNLSIIESDVYGPLATASARLDNLAPPPPPIATLAPERTWYICNASKAAAPGLRVGFLVAPDSASFDRLCLGMRAMCYAPSALGSAIVAQWMQDGTAADILMEITREASDRVRLATAALGNAAEIPSWSGSLHIWLPMSELRAERIASIALRHGAILTPPSALIVAGEHMAGLRLCLSAPAHRSTLRNALDIVSIALREERQSAQCSVV